MKNLSVALFFILSTDVYAAELNLACVLENPKSDSGMDIRTVFIGESEKLVTLRTSSQPKAKKIRVSRYAVVVEIIPEEEDTKYEYYTLMSRQFELLETDANQYSFTNLVTGQSGDCSLNQEVFPNPAMSGSN